MRKAFHLIVRARRSAAVGMVCGAALGTAAAALAATTATSSTGYTAVVDGHQYGVNSTVYVGEPGSPSDWASTYMFTTNGASVGSGWMGDDARKFKNGSLCEQTGYLYNGSPASGMSRLADSTACGSGTYYSEGVIAVWNGSGYDYYYSPRSPSLNG